MREECGVAGCHFAQGGPHWGSRTRASQAEEQQCQGPGWLVTGTLEELQRGGWGRGGVKGEKSEVKRQQSEVFPPLAARGPPFQPFALRRPSCSPSISASVSPHSSLLPRTGPPEAVTGTAGSLGSRQGYITPRTCHELSTK